MIWDQAQDVSGADTHIIFSLMDVPSFVKSASEEQLRGDAQLANHMFGDPIQRKFPAHNPAATWLSSAFLQMKAAEYEPAYVKRVQASLNKAASFWGILPTVEQIRERFKKQAENQLDNLPDSAFALVWEYADGTKERNYPLRTAAEVKQAADWFNRFRDDFTFDDRHTIASRLIEKAASFQVELEPELEELLQKTAGGGTSPVDDVSEMLHNRAAEIYPRNSEVAKALTKLAEEVSHNPNQLDRESRLELARHIDTFDRRYGLQHKYAELQRPEDCLFAITPKTAQQVQAAHTCTSSGAIYEKTALASLDLQTVEDWLGTDVAKQVGVADVLVDLEKLAAVAAQLPQEQAIMFDKMAAAAGITPVAVDPRREPALTATELAQLASQYSLD